jgi:hypothetical protein
MISRLDRKNERGTPTAGSALAGCLDIGFDDVENELQ